VGADKVARLLLGGLGKVAAAPEPGAASPTGPGLGLPAAALLALAGGLILNLMPCVFPVLAMKAASLAIHGGAETGEAKRQGLAFGAGAIVTFLVLAGLLIGLRTAGNAVGWGFQLQDPPVVAVLALLMLAVALISGILWFVPLAVIAAFLTQKLAIEGEERHLAARFGKRYVDYRKRVRRWI
jgi:thiol:disulfide interchange protein